MEVLHIKVDQTKLPNKMHLDAQMRFREQVYKPRKGKGSFKRNKRVDY